MGTAATRAKNKYNAKNYARINLRVKAGEEVTIKRRAEALGKSLNSYISDLISVDMKRGGQ